MDTVARGKGGSPNGAFAALFTPKLITVLREGYGLAEFRADALAGLTVAVVALPLSMAIAIASGVTPDRGLYTAIVGGFLVSALGGSRFQIGGPAGAFIVLVASTVAAHGVEGLIIATMLSGLIMAVVGLLRLGSYVKFIPYPVTVGFTAGIAVIIFASQIKDLLGLTIAGGEPGEILPKLRAIGNSIHTATPAAIVISVVTVAIIVGIKKLRPGWPGMIIAIAAAAVGATVLGLPVETIGSRFGAMPASLPLPALPEVTFATVAAVLPNAIAFALLGSIESLLSAVVADGMTGRRHRSNCELVAQGIANIGSGLFGGICVTGTIARTVTNVRAGAHGPVSGMMHSLFLLLFLLVAAPLAAFIPLAALAGVLAVVAWNMAEKHEFVTLLRASKGDALVLLATFLLTVFRDLTEGIVVGFTIGALLFIHRMAESAGVSADKPVTLEDVPDFMDTREEFDARLASDPDLVVYRISGALFFGAASTVGAVLDRIADQRKAFVIDFSAVALLDSTGAHAIEGAARKAARDNVAMYITGASTATRHMLITHGVREPLVRYRASIDDAVSEIRGDSQKA
ncbi:MAG: SulP family inorganic anion transporter [Flavobacteriaceae bacterium]